MSDIKPIIESHSIVLRGDFNPKIFQPAWFSNEGLIKKSEEQSSKIEIIHQEIVSFKSDWLHLQVKRDSFSATTTQVPYYEPLRDLIFGTFKILIHTPLIQMGLNYEVHYEIDTREKWNKFGDLLAPKEPWSKIIDEPGMRSLTMVQKNRNDNLNGYIQIRVEPSLRVDPGLFISSNDHYEIENNSVSHGANEILNILNEEWTSSFERSKNIMGKLTELI